MQARQVLHRLIETACPWIHAVRRQALSVVVLSAMTGGRLTVTDLGRSLRSEAKEKHCIKRADRLLSNRHLQEERFEVYAALARLLIGCAFRPVVIVDWSDLDEAKTHFLLRASTPVGGRAVTLYEEVHTLKTKEKPNTHRAFLKRLQTILPEGCRPIIVTDAGFRTPWFTQVEDYGWDWIGRIRHRHQVRLDKTKDWVACKSFYSRATAIPKALGSAHLTKSNPLECQLVLYKAKPKGRSKMNRFGERSRSRHSEKNAARNREPWLLATSLPSGSKLAQRVVALYAARMQIEEAFRDLKSSRFGLSLEYSGTRELERLQILLLIGSLALIVLWLLGKATELTRQHPYYQANTIRNRVVLSTIFIGFRVLNDKRVSLTAGDILAAVRMLQKTVQAPMRIY
jgi:hypothetical protein